MARSLGAGVGDTVKILTTRPGLRYGFVPRLSTATVTGIFTTGYQELDRLWGYIPLATGLRILAPESSQDFLGVKLEEPFARLPRQVARLEPLLAPTDRIYTWYELEMSNYRSFQTTRALLLFIMAMIVAVAAVNISSSLIMVVLEKRVEIGVLKAMGASPSTVSASLVICGFLAGLAGALIGTSLGLFLAVNINELIHGAEVLLNLVVGAGAALLRPLLPLQPPAEPLRIFNAAFYLESIPIRIRLPEVLLSAGLTVLLATLAAWFPARRAGRIRPLEVIRRVLAGDALPDGGQEALEAPLGQAGLRAGGDHRGLHLLAARQGQPDDPRARQARFDAPGGLQAVDAGQGHVHQDHVRVEHPGQADRLLPGGRLAHHQEVGLGVQQRGQDLPDPRVVVRQQDSQDRAQWAHGATLTFCVLLNQLYDGGKVAPEDRRAARDWSGPPAHGGSAGGRRGAAAQAGAHPEVFRTSWKRSRREATIRSQACSRSHFDPWRPRICSRNSSSGNRR